MVGVGSGGGAWEVKGGGVGGEGDGQLASPIILYALRALPPYHPAHRKKNVPKPRRFQKLRFVDFNLFSSRFSLEHGTGPTEEI